jgi:glutamate formiminotransferase
MRKRRSVNLLEAHWKIDVGEGKSLTGAQFCRYAALFLDKKIVKTSIFMDKYRKLPIYKT